MNFWRFNNGSYEGFGRLFGFMIPLMLLDLALRGYALWKSARKGQNIWFVFLLIVNSLGILPLIYLLLNRDKKKK